MNNLIKKDKLTRNSVLLVFALTALYLITAYFLVGFKSDQLFLAGIFNAFFFISTHTRKFIIGFSIFIVYWILFDFMKAFPNYTINHVRIAELYNAEKSFFGIVQNGVLVTPNEYFNIHQKVWIDILAGIFYLCWIPVPLAFAAYLFFKDKNYFLRFSLTFVLVNLIGFVIYYVYPAAPPWYISLHGNNFIASTPGNTAGLHRFDDLIGLPIFKGLYSKSSNVFAAMPSLHSSYPLIVLYYAVKRKMGFWTLFFAIVMFGIWFTAVYSNHHYLLDVIAGILCAIAGIFIFEKWYMRNYAFNKLILQYAERLK